MALLSDLDDQTRRKLEASKANKKLAEETAKRLAAKIKAKEEAREHKNKPL